MNILVLIGAILAFCFIVINLYGAKKYNWYDNDAVLLMSGIMLFSCLCFCRYITIPLFVVMGT